MSQTDDALLLLDDGELDPVVSILERSGLSYRRLRGGEISEDLPPPKALLIATPRHVDKVRPGSPPGALPGRPVRIVAVQEDSPSLRRMMRSKGFHLLIRQPAHETVWRLSIQRALFQGDERRREVRLPVGAQISLTPSDTEPADAQPTAPRPSILLDISNRGCHFAGDTPFPIDAHVSFELSANTTGTAPLVLRGRIIRTGPWQVAGDRRHSCAMLFDDDLDEASRTGLARMINARISGPLSLADPAPEALSLPAIDSPALPGLELDDETDPAVRASVPVELSVAGEGDAGGNRRKQRRGNYQQRIEVECSGDTTVLMGRDLSATGMRVERFADAHVGAHLELALYGPSEAEPIPIDAEIVRDDGERGIALRFCNLSRDDANKLERFIACLPAVESLEDPEAAGMGAVLTEVLSG
ncbi:MAG: PilZ domain-containing protein [Myxococcota bacterium]|jgi:hypothetical protein|nr:PilZ domain-containing protein [Myxococcota bacterium]